MSHKITVVLVHGWGMNSGVWKECIESLPDWMSIECVDLPGHGTQSNQTTVDFEAMVSAVADRVTAPVVLVGWSLGGLICLKLAELFPEKVAGLCLVSTNPCFVKRDNWSVAIDQSIFDEFSAALKRDIEKTIKRFLALQVAGSKTTMVTVKKLQAALQDRGMASNAALQSGLDTLSGVDLRESLVSIDAPVLWLLGAKDSLVPVAISDSLQALHPGSEVRVIEGAAHAPFISHPLVFSEALIRFASGLR